MVTLEIIVTCFVQVTVIQIPAIRRLDIATVLPVSMDQIAMRHVLFTARTIRHVVKTPVTVHLGVSMGISHRFVTSLVLVTAKMISVPRILHSVQENV